MPHKDPEAHRAYQAEYRRRTADARAERRPNDDRSRHANRRAALAGVPGRLTIADIRAVMTADARCAYCGSQDRLTIDHVVPMSAGGPNELGNLQACCFSCNASKHRADRPGRWARYHDACLGCGTSDKEHCARGLCHACYRKANPRRSRRRVA